MPELPEVETLRKDLLVFLKNKRIVDLSIKLERLIKSDLKEFKKTIKNNSFKNIRRVGKLMIFELEKSDKTLLVHLKMTGQLIYVSQDSLVAGGHSDSSSPEFSENKYSKLIFQFSDGSKLFFNDMRTFGALKLVDVRELIEIINKFGIEPLQKDFRLKSFQKIVEKRSLNIKALLLNQNLVSGIGNIYADEILFRAGVRPDRLSKELSKSEIKKIWQSTEVIIKKAIKERGTTFNNYRDARGKKGNFVKFLKVYGRGGEKCKKCKSVLNKIKLSGRGTVYCSVCQK